ncbi:unnamed protein product [Ilex paraguariensis]|uniref:Dirigent protein n=1 Tax=Ilex paraguariensis TaxID=185542 RepID=A0ABC8TSX0_9AQUA
MASFLNCTLFTFILLIPTFIGNSDGAFSEELSENILMNRMEKTTHLHFYLHDIVSGNDPSAVRIAGTSDTTGFGATFIMDDALTEGPNPTSRLIGRAQGLYSLAAQHDTALLMVVNYAFIGGKYNGSSISILGRNPVLNDAREMPIVGGCGLFRLARGYAVAHSISFDRKMGDATVEYNVYVQHY